MNRTIRVLMALAFLGMFVPLGCDNRATQIAIDAADRQAEQNQELARLDREHAAARRELVELHQQVQSERQTLSESWQNLHGKQQAVIEERRTESLVRTLVPVLLAVVLGGVAAFLVSRWLDFRTVQTTLDAELQAIRVQQLEPSTPRQLEQYSTPEPGALPHESPSDDHDPGA